MKRKKGKSFKKLEKSNEELKNEIARDEARDSQAYRRMGEDVEYTDSENAKD